MDAILTTPQDGGYGVDSVANSIEQLGAKRRAFAANFWEAYECTEQSEEESSGGEDWYDDVKDRSGRVDDVSSGLEEAHKLIRHRCSTLEASISAALERMALHQGAPDLGMARASVPVPGTPREQKSGAQWPEGRPRSSGDSAATMPGTAFEWERQQFFGLDVAKA